MDKKTYLQSRTMIFKGIKKSKIKNKAIGSFCGYGKLNGQPSVEILQKAIFFFKENIKIPKYFCIGHALRKLIEAELIEIVTIIKNTKRIGRLIVPMNGKSVLENYVNISKKQLDITRQILSKERLYHSILLNMSSLKKRLVY